MCVSGRSRPPPTPLNKRLLAHASVCFAFAGPLRASCVSCSWHFQIKWIARLSATHTLTYGGFGSCVCARCDPLLQRAAAVRSLGAVRAVQEQQLMRHNSDGTKQLDHKGAELLLKIVALQVNPTITLTTPLICELITGTALYFQPTGQTDLGSRSGAHAATVGAHGRRRTIGKEAGQV